MTKPTSKPKTAKRAAVNPAPAKRGRPTKYTEGLSVEICERLSDGEPLAQICRDDHMPAVRTVSHWKDASADFKASFGRAREDGYDAIAARLRETARGKGDSTQDVQRDKLIIDTDLKLLAKWDYKRYGDKLDLNHGGSVEITGMKLEVVDPSAPSAAKKS